MSKMGRERNRRDIINAKGRVLFENVIKPKPRDKGKIVDRLALYVCINE